MGENEDRERKLKNFKAWFLQQWSAWDDKVGNRTTQQELADHLGITRASVAAYRLGNQLPEGENLLKIARVMGRDIYRVLEIPPDLPDLAIRASSALDEIRIILERDNISVDTPEAEQITIEIMERFGFKYVSTEELPD